MFQHEYTEPKLVAEIGCNHMGSMDVARELISLAQQCGVRHVKFQKRTVRDLLTREQYETPHPNPQHSYGPTYGAHREFLELNQEQHAELLRHCRSLGMEYSSSVWDVRAAHQIIDLQPTFIKVPSATNNDLALLRVLRDEYDGIVQVSLGMTTGAEAEAVVKCFEESGAARHRLVLFSCTSGYPVPFEDVSLLEIERLHRLYGDRVREIGFSGHHLGIAIDVAAFALGACWIERHFTKDRTWKGTDHAASLEPPGLAKLSRDLQAAYRALSYKRSEILEIERPQREKLKSRV